MSRNQHTAYPNNLAARMGRWSADSLEDRHLRLARLRRRGRSPSAAWSGRRTSTRARPGRASPAAWTGSSTRASRSLPPRTSSSRAARLARATPAFDAAIEDVVARLTKESDVQNVRSPVATGNAGQISKDGHSALVQFELRGDEGRSRRQDRPGPRRRRRRAAAPIAASRSTSSATRARRRVSRRRSPTTSRRPGCSRCRSR